MPRTLTCLLLAGLLGAADRPSTIPSLPSQQGLVVLGSELLPLPPAGEDATAAIQAGIDRGGVVVLPSGRYRVDGTLNLWKGVRLIGVGPSKPVLERPAGGSDGHLVHFRSDKPKPGQPPRDADNDTFGSGLINLVIAYQPPGFALRYRVAQLCVIESVDFELGDGSGGIREMANVIQDCRFSGGRVAIESGSTVAWQTLLADCHFVGQRQAAVISHGTAPMFIGCRFEELPAALQVVAGKSEMALFEDARFEQVGAVLRVPASEQAFMACSILASSGRETPLLVSRDDGTSLPAPGSDWSLVRMVDGLIVRAADGITQAREHLVEAGAVTPPQRSPLPSFDGLVSVTDFGAVGDGRSDCTEAFRAALAGEAAAVYVPPGRWLLRDTLTLDGADRLLGLHPRATLLQLAPDAPGYADPAAPKAVLAVAFGSSASVRGIGFGHSPQAGTIQIHWRGGAGSRLADCWSQWGPKSGPGPLIELLVEGGGGTFSNLWLVNATAQHAMVVRQSAVPGRVELASLEHHDPEELVLQDVSGWTLHGIQTERGDNHPPALRLERCRDLRFGNLFLYRTSGSRQPRDAAISAIGCRELTVHGLRVYAGTWGGGVDYDHALRLTDLDLAVPQRIAAALLIP